MSENIRVLNSLTESRVGGPHLRSLDVATQLRKQDIETIFLIPDGSDEFEELATGHGFEIYRPGLRQVHPPTDLRNNASYLLNFPCGVRSIQKLLSELEIDVIHAGMTLNFQAALAAHRSSVPLAWFFNDTGTPWPLNRIVAEMAKQTADEIAVAADAVHEYFFADSVSTRTIYPPVDTSEFHPDNVSEGDPTVHEEFGIDANVPILSVVGNLNPAKGHTHLLKAVARVEQRVGRVAVLVAGKVLETRQDYFENLQQLRTQLDLEHTVQFIGRRSDIARLLKGSDVFVLPSVKEACPIAVLEAMAMQKPIVATRVGGTEEQIVDGEHGWLVPPECSAELADSIVDALQSLDEQQRRGTAARERVTQKFSIERCVESHRYMYTAAIDGDTEDKR